MSILIKGMEMPESCEDCSAQIIDPTGGASGCAVNHSIILRKRGERRPTECPLVEVPKHGRLIDADALITATTDGKTMTVKYTEPKYEIRKVVYVAQESINEIADAVVRKLRGESSGFVMRSDMSDEEIKEILEKLKETWIVEEGE